MLNTKWPEPYKQQREIDKQIERDVDIWIEEKHLSEEQDD